MRVIGRQWERRLAVGKVGKKERTQGKEKEREEREKERERASDLPHVTTH